jgi:hypothetical protein
MSLRRYALPALLAAVLAACATVPNPAETLAGFELLLPDTATFGLPFDLTVRSVGSNGTVPFPTFSGEVEIASDRGEISRSSLDLSGGTGTVGVVMLAEAGSVTLSVEAGGKRGSGSTTVAFLEVLPGNPGDPLPEAIPSIDFEPRFATYSDGHPDLPGALLSYDTLGLGFEPGTTNGQANAVLATFVGKIVGGIPGVSGRSTGLLILRTPTSTHAEMEALLDQLEADPAVATAVQDALLIEELVPNSNDGTTPPGWTWDTSNSGGNWGMEFIRAPQMWNLNAAIAKQLGGGTDSVVTGVIDSGFCAHSDLSYLDNDSNFCSDHGTHVAGTIGAQFGDGDGVDGVNRFAELVTYARLNGSSEFFWLDSIKRIMRDHPGVRVINRSLGGGYDTSSEAGFVKLEGHANRLVDTLRTFADPPLIIESAGNDTTPARLDSAVAFAGLDLNEPNILVIEAIDDTGTRWTESNTGGHLSAPGVDVLSTIDQDMYGEKSGTSMAAPHVAGLASFLFSLDPTLSNAEVRELLAANTQAVAGSGSPAPAIDAFAAAMDIDRVRSNDRVLRMLLDIDDGTLDGNQRLVIGTNISITDADGDGIAEGALDDQESLRFRELGTFAQEDVDIDGGIGDGNIDMSDFRRWRDWLLQATFPDGNIVSIDLDGSANHPKKDPNGNGTPSEGPDENVFPRGDFNGDGVLSETASSFVPGAIDNITTDLNALKELFSDSNYVVTDLDSLIESADITISPHLCFALDAFTVTEATSSVRLKGADVGDTVGASRTHASNDIFEIYTVGRNVIGYTARVEAKDGSGNVVGVYEDDFIGLDAGADVLFDECDPRPLLNSVTADPTSITAIPGPTELFTEFDFTLEFDDAGKNLEFITPIFALGDTLITPTPLTVDDASVSGFDNADTGPGTVTFDLLVFCSENRENPLTAIFTLTDEFDQVTEEKTFDIPVDYSGCPSTVRDGLERGFRVGNGP